MNRTDRLYALVEELRAVSPRPRAGRWLADRFEVSTRTIERDIGALQAGGVPIYAEQGRRGGYVLDPATTLPPVNVSPQEATALAVGLARLSGTPFEGAARTAMQKLVAVMPPRDVTALGELVNRVRLIGATPRAPVPRVVQDAVATGSVLRIRYVDRHGRGSTRVVEPAAFVGNASQWYLAAWCRLRDGLRAFRLDRIALAVATGERVTPRELTPADLDVPDVTVVTLTAP